MDKLNKMQLFCRVVELGSFVAAANDQNISAAIVGRHIADLEAYLKLRLINRTTRSMELTEAGKQYYLGCKTALNEIEALEQDIAMKQHGDLEGIIRLAAPEGIGTGLLLDIIASFQEDYPKIQIDLLLDNSQTDLIGSKIDIALRLASKLDDSSMILKKLGETSLGLYAAPDYIKTKSAPTNIHELKDHDCLHFGASRYGDSWPYIENTTQKKLTLDWKLVFNQTTIYKQAISRGMGIGLLLKLSATDMIKSGEIIEVNIEQKFPTIGIYAIYPSRDYLPKRVSLFLDHLQKFLG